MFQYPPPSLYILYVPSSVLGSGRARLGHALHESNVNLSPVTPTPCARFRCMAHTKYTERVARLWYHMVGLRLQRVQQSRARRRQQRLAGARLFIACGRPAQFAPRPSRLSRVFRFLGWFISELLSPGCTQREQARAEYAALRRQSRRAQWPRRYR